MTAFIVDGDLLTKEELEALARRRRLFETLGFTEVEAFDLATSDVSLSGVRELIMKGCPPELAAQILL